MSISGVHRILDKMQYFPYNCTGVAGHRTKKMSNTKNDGTYPVIWKLFASAVPKYQLTSVSLWKLLTCCRYIYCGSPAHVMQVSLKREEVCHKGRIYKCSPKAKGWKERKWRRWDSWEGQWSQLAHVNKNLNVNINCGLPASPSVKVDRIPPRLFRCYLLVFTIRPEKRSRGNTDMALAKAMNTWL